MAYDFERDENGQPRGRAGAFATVYRVFEQDGTQRALRVWTTLSTDERRERYAAVCSYLAGRKISSLVPIEYLERGVKHSSGTWYPALLMEWIQGEMLFDWLRIHCLAGNRPLLARLRDQWVSLVHELEVNRVAHGDLQHGNILVNPHGELKLVDYDGMCVPELEGRRNLEIGIEPYQHPDRDERTLMSPSLDNFSAIVIYVAIHALSVEPGLWARFIEMPNGECYDKLLFRREDFDQPKQSELIQTLRALPDNALRQWTDTLLELASSPIDDVPSLSTLVDARNTG